MDCSTAGGGIPESARKRKYYRITRKGQRELSRLRAEWKAYASMVEKIVDGGERFP